MLHSVLQLCPCFVLSLSFRAVRFRPSIKAQTHSQPGCGMFGSAHYIKARRRVDCDALLPVLLQYRCLEWPKRTRDLHFSILCHILYRK